MRRVTAALLCCLGLAGTKLEASPQQTPVVRRAVRADISPPLRLIEPLARLGGQAREHLLDRLPRLAGGLGSLFPDPARQQANSIGSLPDPLRSFEGLSNIGSSTNTARPDTEGNVGPNHYVQWVNFSFAIYDKTGRLLYGPAAGNTLWAGFGGLCETQNDGDPIVRYDHLADRWLMSQIAVPERGPYYQCLAISQTPDPTGPYYRYAFKISDVKQHDYSKFAVWPDAYYMSWDETLCQGTDCIFGEGAGAFERTQMLAGNANARAVLFEVPYPAGRIPGATLPSDLNGPPPPPGSPNFFAEVVFPEIYPTTRHMLQIFRFHVDWNDLSASTFSGPALLDTAPFKSSLCPSDICVPQPGTEQKLQAYSDLLMSRLQYRNFGDHESLVANHTVDVGGNQAGIRWYELRKSGAGDWQLYQQGTYAPDNQHRWMGSIGMDKDGNIALGYSVSSRTTFPSIAYVGRQASDPLGTMAEGETWVIAGRGSQLDKEGHWGDYSMMAIDPRDDCTFWYTQEYYPFTSEIEWHTRIAAFAFRGCNSALPDFAISASPNSQAIAAGQTATYLLSVGGSNEFRGTVSLSCTSAPPASTCSVSPVSVMVDGSDPVTANLDVSTTARSLSTLLLQPPLLHSGLLPSLLLPLLPLLLTNLSVRANALLGRATRVQPRLWVGLAGLLYLATLLSSCGGDPRQGTRPGNYTLKLTGTSSSLRHEITLDLTVR